MTLQTQNLHTKMSVDIWSEYGPLVLQSLRIKILQRTDKILIAGVFLCLKFDGVTSLCRTICEL